MWKLSIQWILGRLAVPPCTRRQLARAAVFHRGGRRGRGTLAFVLPPRARQQGRSEHVRIVDRVLTEIVIADAGSLFVVLAWKREDPSTRAVGDVKEAAVSEKLKRVEERLADEGSPDDDRFVLRVMPATARVVEVIGPGVLPELRRLVLDEPLESC